MSYGGCEYSSETSVQGTIYQSGANAGIAFIASSGDQGDQCYSGQVNNQASYAVGVNYPAADANVIAVGGTQTYTVNAPSNSLLSTNAWNDNTFSVGNVQLASGGGYSRYVPQPSYQSTIGGFSPQFKNVPDIAMPAIGTLLYDNAQTTPDGGEGTSWSAPLFAAMMAEVYQYCGASFTNAASIPYYVYSHARSAAFLDITSGNNQYQGDGSYFRAQPGYDNVTGLGVPFGMPFANTICPNRVPASFMRAPAIATTQAVRRSATAVQIDAVPSVRGLVDVGRRASATSTDIQLVLQPGASIASDEQSVIAVLQAAGFRITQTFGNHLVVDAEGPSSAVEQLFSTQLHDETQGRYGTRYLPVSTVTLPASLAPYVSGVSLDNVVTATHR
jgi:subtilase family serine protease